MKFRVEKAPILCVVLGITFCVLSFTVENRLNSADSDDFLKRNGYGGGTREQEVLVDGLLEKEIPVTVELGEREYGEDEAEAAFPAAFENMLAGMLGENQSLEQVKGNLELPVWLEEYGIGVSWESEDSGLVESGGEVHNDDCPKEGVKVNLTAILKAGNYTREYSIPVMILPPDRTEAESRLREFLSLVSQLEKEHRKEETLRLPDEFKGRDLEYRKEPSGDYLIFPALGVLAAVLLSLRKGQQEKEARKKRERSLLCDYSEIISKLVVFLGAGLPARKAWERIVYDYESRIDKPEKRRPAYEEMAHAFYLMGRGVPETRAYAQFGERCRILPYRKLSGILEQNVRNGSGDLCKKLEAEMQDAFEQRKQLARRMGEEAGTKLLFPLFLLLAVVMVMVSMPAFLSFGF